MVENPKFDWIYTAIENWLSEHHQIGVDCTVSDFINMWRAFKYVQEAEEWFAKRGRESRDITVYIGKREDEEEDGR